MKIAAFPKGFIQDICYGKMELEDWIDMSIQLEPEGLEIYYKFLKSFDSGYLKTIKTKAETYNLPIPMMCFSPDFTIPDRDYRKREIEKQKEMIRVTAELGGRYCRTLSGQRRPEVSVRDGINYVVECITECLPEAEKYDVRLVIENHYKDTFWQYPEFGQNMDIFLEILGRVKSPFLGVQFDPSNSLVGGEDPLLLLEKVKERLFTMHASDRYIAKGYTLADLRKKENEEGYSSILVHGIVGKGLNDYNTIFSVLKKIDFNGWVSIEDGNSIQEMKQSIKFLKELRRKYEL